MMCRAGATGMKNAYDAVLKGASIRKKISRDPAVLRDESREWFNGSVACAG